jgi:hypothetical protein
MTTESLRIGNLVERKTNNGEHICFEKVERIEGVIYGKLQSSQCYPIKLNPDWLKKIGAKPISPMSKGFWISVTNLKAELHFEIYQNTDEIVTSIKSSFSDLILDRIRYVHDLQNLYFQLTKSELVVVP